MTQPQPNQYIIPLPPMMRPQPGPDVFIGLPVCKCPECGGDVYKCANCEMSDKEKRCFERIAKELSQEQFIQ